MEIQRITCELCNKYLYLKKGTGKYFPCGFKNPNMSKHIDCLSPEINKCHCVGKSDGVMPPEINNVNLSVSDLLKQIEELKRENEELRARNNFLEVRASYIWNNSNSEGEYECESEDERNMAECEEMMFNSDLSDNGNYDEFEKDGYDS